MCYIALIILLIASTNPVASLNVSFSQSTYSVNEDDGLVQPVLVLSNPSSTDITVQVRDNSNTATGEYTQQHYYKQHVNSNNLTGGGVDYNSGPYDVTFSAGMTRLTFDISIMDDNIYEGNELFMLAIMSSPLPSRVSLGSPSMATVTIVDTTSELVTIMAVENYIICFVTYKP